MNILLVGLGGAVGAISRYLVNLMLIGSWATLAVNIVGSFCVGLVLASLKDHPEFSQLYLLLVVGFAGGFTTFSAFSAETFRLIESQQWGLAVFGVGANVILSVGAFAFGTKVF